MADFPLVSVIIPVYNGADYFLEAIESVLHQTYPHVEIIVIDDCSTDNSVELIESVDADNLTLIRNSNNLGVSASRNKGICSAKGKYIAFMDADDVSLPRRLECQVDLLERKSEIGLISSAYETFEEDLSKGKRSLKKLPTDPEDIAARLLFQCVICCPAAMLRAALIEPHGLYFDESLSMCEDWDLWYRISKVSKVSNIEDVLLYYRKHSSNSSKKRAEMYRSKIRLMQRSLRDYGVSTKGLFSDEFYLKGEPEFCLFVERVELFAKSSGTVARFSEKEIVRACAYALYEIYKTNVQILGGSAYDVLRSSWLYKHMDISWKNRIRYFLRCKLARLNS